MVGTLDSLLLDESDLHLLPPSAQWLVREIGLPSTLKLVEVYGGTPICVPKRVGASCELLDVLGEDVFLKLQNKCSGMRLEIPRCLKAIRYIIYRKIRQDAASGIPQSELARRYKYTTRNIRKIEMRGEPEAETNLSLW